MEQKTTATDIIRELLRQSISYDEIVQTLNNRGITPPNGAYLWSQVNLISKIRSHPTTRNEHKKGVRKITPEQVVKMFEMFEQNKNIVNIAEHFNLSRARIYQYRNKWLYKKQRQQVVNFY